LSGAKGGKNLLKIVGTVALVGTIASAALLGVGLSGAISNNSNSESSSSSISSGMIDGITRNLVSKLDPEVEKAFTSYIAKHQRSFLTKEEYKARLQNFKSAYNDIKLHNADTKSSYKMSLNQFSDWSQ
jgi:hypothetical protein